jgi:hypothetical protein
VHGCTQVVHCTGTLTLNSYYYIIVITVNASSAATAV